MSEPRVITVNVDVETIKASIEESYARMLSDREEQIALIRKIVREELLAAQQPGGTLNPDGE